MGIYKLRTEFGHQMKWILGIIALIFLVGAIWSFGTAPSGDNKSGGDGSEIVAKVNGKEISRSAFDSVWQQQWNQAQQRARLTPLQYADMRGGILRQIIYTQTLLDSANALGVDVSDSKVEEVMNELIGNYLRQNRSQVMGKLTKEQEAVDPRDDKKYRDELASVGSSIKQQEEMAKSMISEDQVRAMLAQQGIEGKLQVRVKQPTAQDVTNSYNVYKIRYVLIDTGRLPGAQAQTKAKGVAEAAKGGADFAKLARENSDSPNKSQGGAAVYSWESRFFPPKVRAAIEKMSAGEVSPVIDAGFGLYVVKLESVTPRIPANLDAKAGKQRRQEILQDRLAQVKSEFDLANSRQQKVEVLDPERRGYWNLGEAQMAAGDPTNYAKLTNMAIASLKAAVKKQPNNLFARSKLAQVYAETGKYEDAVAMLYPMLEGKEAITEGADLRILLGDSLMKIAKPEPDRALYNYGVASEVAVNDPMIHQQLIPRYQQMKRPDLVAAEQKWMADYKVKLAQFQKMQGEKGTPGRPGAPRPAPRPE